MKTRNGKLWVEVNIRGHHGCPSDSYVGVLTLSTSDCDRVWGWVFSEVISEHEVLVKVTRVLTTGEIWRHTRAREKVMGRQGVGRGLGQSVYKSGATKGCGATGGWEPSPRHLDLGLPAPRTEGSSWAWGKLVPGHLWSASAW